MCDTLAEAFYLCFSLRVSLCSLWGDFFDFRGGIVLLRRCVSLEESRKKYSQKNFIYNNITMNFIEYFAILY